MKHNIKIFIKNGDIESIESDTLTKKDVELSITNHNNLEAVMDSFNMGKEGREEFIKHIPHLKNRLF